MNIASQILKQNEEDNMILDRLVNDSAYQQYEAKIYQDWDSETTTYTFEDGSKLINKNNDWQVK